MIKIANKNGSRYTSELEEFQGSNTYAIDYGKIYVVYSYGEHFPMYIYDKLNTRWLENSNKYSSSTSKQQSQLRPVYHGKYNDQNILKSTTAELKEIISKNRK